MDVKVIPEDRLVEGRIYAVNTRNLRIAMWDGDGFVGVRTKFDFDYMTKESGVAFDVGNSYFIGDEYQAGGYDEEQILLLADWIKEGKKYLPNTSFGGKA